MNECPFISIKKCEVPSCDSCVNFMNCSFRDTGKEFKKDEKHGKMRPMREK